MTKELKPKVCAVDKESGIESLAAQIADGIMGSRVFICCITEQYSNSLNCQKDFGLAESEKKPMIILMFHRLIGMT